MIKHLQTMDSSSYGAAHLSSPALVVFSQAANGLSDALRLQRPFPSQMPDAKDLHNFSLSYGAHLLHGFQPHFLHPHLNPAVSSANTTNPFSGGGAFVKPFPSSLPLSSAFAPPKCLGFGLDQSLLFGGSESYRTDSSSPACTSLSPPTKDESMEGHTSEEGDRDRDRICSPSRSSPGETPGFRRVGPKKPTIGTPSPTTQHGPICPVCGTQIPQSELESHYAAELNRLAKPNSFIERQELRRTLSMEMHAVQNSYQGRTSRWETFNRIRTNRQSRLRGKFRKRRFDGSDDFSPVGQCQSCPVCHGRLQRTPEEITQHIEDCARKQQQQAHQSQQNENTTQANPEEDETVDVESFGDETSNGAINMIQPLNNNNNNNNLKIEANKNLEESTLTPLHPAHHWERKHRMHLAAINCKNKDSSIAVLEDFYKRACFAGNPPPPVSHAETIIPRVTTTSIDHHHHQRMETSEYTNEIKERNSVTNHMITDADEEVVVDNNDENSDNKRHSVSISPSNTDKNSTEEATSSVEIDSATDMTTPVTPLRPTPVTPNSESYVSTSETSTEPPASKAQVLEELKARIRELEGSPHYKCFICKEGCKTLVISTICGHYLCEDCWISESDTKKSCPRCKIITHNSDFRKIHV